MTTLIRTITEWRKLRAGLSNNLGFVPTMGNLHVGHFSLLERSKQENENSVLSIFVNPAQFNNANDYVHYPKTLDQDLELADKAKIDYVFVPTFKEIYPDDYAYQVNECDFSEQLEGAFRPGHFNGMLTVVLKLLLLMRAQRAYFGEKDYQQLALVKGMVKSFFIDTEIIGCPTIRNDFGLPYSSRNNRLTPEQYQQARYFPEVFHQSEYSCAEIKNKLTEYGFIVDYVEEYDGRRFAAVHLGDVRLIDNFMVD